MTVDRSEAVNLARNFLRIDGESGMRPSHKGVVMLAKAVLLMDSWIRDAEMASHPLDEKVKRRWLIAALDNPMNACMHKPDCVAAIKGLEEENRCLKPGRDPGCCGDWDKCRQQCPTREDYQRAKFGSPLSTAPEHMNSLSLECPGSSAEERAGVLSKGIWRISLSGITLNECAGPVNFTLLFPWSPLGFFVYGYAFGRRWCWPKALPK